MTVRGPRLLLPSGLLLVLAAMIVPLTSSANRSSAPARLLLVALLSAAIADGWLAHRSLRRVRGRIVTPTLATCGRPFFARAELWGVRRPSTVDARFGQATAVPFIEHEPFELACNSASRGTFHQVLIEVHSRSPLGLWTAARRLSIELLVPLDVAPQPRPQPSGGPKGWPVAEGELEPAPQPGSDLVRSVRDYQAGDSARSIHWPATAHHGRLLVRENEAERRPVPIVAVVAHHAGSRSEDTFGRALTAVAELLALGSPVRLITTESPPGPPAPLARAVLVPGTRVRGRAPMLSDGITIDATVADLDSARRRLARAVPTPPTEGEWRELAHRADVHWIRDDEGGT